MNRSKLSKGVHLLPSLFTTGSLFCSFFSIVRSIHGDHYWAAWAIFVASFFDLVDGRLARMTRTESEFGREYDSLVDLASFGLAPAILVYTWSLQFYRPVGWFIAFLYFACAALRLARFNVRTEIVEKKRFQGLPSPLAACLLGSLVIFYQHLQGVPAEGTLKSPVALIVVPIAAILMVSNIPYRSFKEYDLGKKNSFYVLIGAAAIIGLIAVNPDIVLFLGFLLYALSGPVGRLIVMQRKGRAAARPRATTRRRKLAVLDVSRENVASIKKIGHE